MKGIKRNFSIVALIVLLGAAAAMSGQTRDQNFKACNGVLPSKAIAGCSALLQSPGLESSQNLALEYFERARAYEQKGQDEDTLKYDDDALKDIEQAVKLNPNVANFWSMYGVINSDMFDNEAAIQKFNQALALDPNLAHVNLYRGKAYFTLSEYGKAIADLDRAIQLWPKDAEAFYMRGVVYRAKREPDRAIEDFNHALLIKPRYEDAYSLRASAYNDKQEFGRAIADYNRALALKPSDWITRSFLASAYLEAGNGKLALETYEHILRLRPDSVPSTFADRCLAHALIGELQLALTDCNKSLKLEADSLAKSKAQPDADSVKFDSELSQLQSAMELEDRGIVYLKLKDPNRAIADFDAALKIDRKRMNSLYGRGLAKRMSGDLAGSVRDFAAAKAIKPDIAAQFARWGFALPGQSAARKK